MRLLRVSSFQIFHFLLELGAVLIAVKEGGTFLLTHPRFKIFGDIELKN